MKIEKWPESLLLDKLDVAERQMRTAIRMFFEQADPVSTQTIAAAAYQVLLDLGEKHGKTSYIKNSDLVRPERRKEWIAALNRAPNFFKHADRDPDEKMEFRPTSIEADLIDSVFLFQQLKSELFLEARIFQTWFMLKHPEFLLESKLKEHSKEALASGLDPNDFEMVLLALNKAK